MLTLLSASLALVTPIVRADSPTYLYAQSPCTPVYAAPSTQSTLITQLLGGTDVTVAADGTDATWTHVRIWSGLDGYIPTKALGARSPDHPREGVCNYPGLPDAEAVDLPPDQGPWPLAAQGVVTSPATVYTTADDGSVPVAALALGQSVAITQWVAGARKQPWYRVDTPGGGGWVWSGSIRLSLPDPTMRQVGGGPIWAPVAGKGMWFTNYLPHHADVGAMMRAAKIAGMTHVYAEVAISKYGFYAENTLERLIPAAHAAGIKVIAWVYPDLKNVSNDVRLSALVAAYKTPGGEHADGLAADIEEVTDSGSVYTYGQALRGLLGPDALMVAAVYHPFARPDYPYAALAASFNVLAPMDYWHSRQGRAYSPADVRRFVTTSILSIRAALTAGGVRVEMPIAELGQTYNMYTDDFTVGPDAPTPEEITADLDAARASGCIGISFFEWQTATQPQWAAITQYVWT